MSCKNIPVCLWKNAKTYQDICNIATRAVKNKEQCMMPFYKPYDGRSKNVSKNISRNLLETINSSGFITLAKQEGISIGVTAGRWLPAKDCIAKYHVGVDCNSDIKHIQKASVTGLIQKEDAKKIIKYCHENKKYNDFTVSINDGSGAKYYKTDFPTKEISAKYFVMSSPLLKNQKIPSENYTNQMFNHMSEINPLYDELQKIKYTDTKNRDDIIGKLNLIHTKMDQINECTCNTDHGRHGTTHHFSSYFTTENLWPKTKNIINNELYDSLNDKIIGFGIMDNNYLSNNLWDMFAEYYNCPINLKKRKREEDLSNYKFVEKKPEELKLGDIVKFDSNMRFNHKKNIKNIKNYEYLYTENHDKLFKLVDFVGKYSADYGGEEYNWSYYIGESIENSQVKEIFSIADYGFIRSVSVFDEGHRDEGVMIGMGGRGSYTVLVTN
jgi:hypothetical protein